MSKPTISKNIELPENIIKELLTDSEIIMVKQRFMIINLLNNGLTIRAIAEKVGVGTDTVVRVAKKLKDSQKLRDYIEKKSPESPSKWVFGSIGPKE